MAGFRVGYHDSADKETGLTLSLMLLQGVLCTPY
jgi:hypothetical protein